MGKRVRTYRKEDKEEILAFTKDMYAPNYMSFLLDFHEKHQKRTIPFVYVDGNEIRAVCIFHFCNDEDGWLMGMRVKKEFQKSGIATEFTEELIRFARDRKLTWLGLNTSFKNRSVHNICKRLGFERNGAYYIYEFNPAILKRLKQSHGITLDAVEDVEEANKWFKRKRAKQYLFVVDPGFIWIRLTDNIIKQLLNLQGLHYYQGKMVSMQRWGEFLTFNFFGDHGFIDHVDFLAQLYREYPDPSKGRIIYCVRKGHSKGIDELYGKLATPKALEKWDVEKSDWYLYGRDL